MKVLMSVFRLQATNGWGRTVIIIPWLVVLSMVSGIEYKMLLDVVVPRATV